MRIVKQYPCFLLSIKGNAILFKPDNYKLMLFVPSKDSFATTTDICPCNSTIVGYK